MAILGRWTGGTTTLLPTTSWVAPNGLFTTQVRNDLSSYSFTSSTSTLTLPSSGLADGYMVVGSFEFEDTSNGRHAPHARFVQTSGTGNFVSGQGAGYNRDNSEDRAYVRIWGFIDNPSAAAEIQFQWKRDTDAPTGGTVQSTFEVIPLYYSDVGLYTSSTAALYGGTTRNIVTLDNTVADGTNITRSGNVVTVAGDNKRYLILSSQFYEGFGGRTQRIFGHNYDGSPDLAAQTYIYSRNTSNDEQGNCITDIIETSTANRTIELTCYRGDGVAAGEGGGDFNGSTPTVADHGLVVIELNDSAEVFRTKDNTGNQNFAETGPIDVPISRTAAIDFNDSASWTRASDNAINAETTMDALFGANVWAASYSLATNRWTSQAHITLNGVEQDTTQHGAYLRGNQGTQDTYGWAANPTGFLSLTAGDDIGVSVTELPGTEGGGGNVRANAGTIGFWGINLDTLEATASTPTNVVSDFDTITLTPFDSVVTAGPPITDLFLAEFTAADGTLLSAYTPDIPADGFEVATSGGLKIQNNTLALASTAGGFFTAKWDLGASPPSEYSVEADIRMYISNANTGYGLLFCNTDSSDTDSEGYLLSFYLGDIILEETVGGGYTVLDSAAYAPTPGSTAKMRVDITATDIKCYIDDVLTVESANTLARGRYFGYQIFASTNAGTVNDTVADNLRVFVPGSSTDVVSDFDTITLTPFDSIVTASVNTNVVSDFDTITLTPFDSIVTASVNTNVVSDFDTITLTPFDSVVTASVNANVVSDFDTFTLTPFDSVVTAGPTPTTDLFLAEFTAADTTALSSYTPDVPANGFQGATANAYHIINNALAIDTPSSSQTIYATWDLGATPPDNYTITLDCTAILDNANTGWGIIFGSTSDPDPSDDCYFLNFFTDTLYMDSRTGGSWNSALASSAYDTTNGQVYEMRVDVSPTALVCYIDGVEIFTVTNSDRRGRYFGYMSYINSNGTSADDVVADNLRVYVPGVVSNGTFSIKAGQFAFSGGWNIT